MITISKIAEKLRDPEYRKAFVASQINVGIPFQLRALLKSRGWTQEQLAERAEMLQPRISDMMKAGKTRPNIETLRRLAGAFDCGLIIRFASFSELAKWSEGFDPDSFHVPSFEDDSGFIDRREPQSALTTAECVAATGTYALASIPSRGDNVVTLEPDFVRAQYQGTTGQVVGRPVEAQMASATDAGRAQMGGRVWQTNL